MEAIVLDSISFDLNAEHVYPLLKIKPESRYAKRLDVLLADAAAIARPKAACRLASVEHTNDAVRVDGLLLQSRVVQVNLQDCRRVFPFMATCGTELEAWSQTFKDTLSSFWADTLNMLALGIALCALENHLKERFGTGVTSTMNPGSLADWPLAEQHKIFSLLGDACTKIGVRLTENTMMVPVKSVSGLMYESGEKFYNCQLCPRKKCPGRRAPYDEHLYDARYRSESHRP
jgi:hypothetical protein